MEFLDLTAANPAQNLAIDSALLDEAEAGLRPETLRVWESPVLCAVLGSSRPARGDLDLAACAAAGVPVVRRSSGGGTVLQGPGCLSYALVLDHARPDLARGIRAADRLVLDRHAAALRPRFGPVERAGVSDLVVAGRKFSGNAQRRRRRFTLYHGTFLYAFDLGWIVRLQPLPERRPAYRGERAHAEFVANLSCARAELVATLRAAWDARQPACPPDPGLVERLLRERYGQKEWTFRL